MVDNKSKTSLISHIQKNISFVKINNIILVLRTRVILLSSFMIYFFCMCHSEVFLLYHPVNYCVEETLSLLRIDLLVKFEEAKA